MIARLVERITDADSRPLFGYLADSVRVTGDIISPIEEEWNACENPLKSEELADKLLDLEELL